MLDDPVLTALVGQGALAGAARRPAGCGSTTSRRSRRRAAQRPRLRRAPAAPARARRPTPARTSATSSRPTGAEAFVDWLPSRRRSGAPGGREPLRVRRLARARRRADAYPDLDGADADGFLGWLWVHGRDGAGACRARCCPPPPEWVEPTARARAARARRRLPARHPRPRAGGARLRRARCRRRTCRSRRARSRSTRPSSGSPRGAAPRPEERAFAELTLPARRRARGQPRCASTPTRLPGFVEELGDETRRTATRSAQWAWETDHVPERWDRAFELVDELWVYSTYVAEQPRARRRRAGRGRAAAGRGARPGRGDAVPFELPGRLRVPVRVRLLLDARAQEPARPGRGVHAARSRPARARRWC